MCQHTNQENILIEHASYDDAMQFLRRLSAHHAQVNGTFTIYGNYHIIPPEGHHLTLLTLQRELHDYMHHTDARLDRLEHEFHEFRDQTNERLDRLEREFHEFRDQTNQRLDRLEREFHEFRDQTTNILNTLVTTLNNFMTEVRSYMASHP